jgi:hypothetical protein
MNAQELFVEIRGGRTAFAPGEVIQVNALWALPDPPTSLEVRLCWFTRGKGTEDAGIVAVDTISAPGPAGEHGSTFTLPEGPYSFSGKLISLSWAVELVALPSRKFARCDLVVAPGGREVVLTPVEKNAPRLR